MKHEKIKQNIENRKRGTKKHRKTHRKRGQNKTYKNLLSFKFHD